MQEMDVTTQTPSTSTLKGIRVAIPGTGTAGPQVPLTGDVDGAAEAAAPVDPVKVPTARRIATAAPMRRIAPPKR